MPPQPNSPSGQCLAAIGPTEDLWLPLESEKPRISGKEILNPAKAGRLPFLFDAMSEATIRVVVFHRRCLRISHLSYTSNVTAQVQIRVKLNRVFFPR